MNQLSGPVLQWIREGYPDGVPDDETAALLAVLQERIGGDRALDVLRRLHKDGRISDTAAAALLPDDTQMRRVAAKLVLGGWPLAGDEEDDDAPPKEGSALARIVSVVARGLPRRCARARLHAAHRAARAAADPLRGQEDRQGAAPGRRQPGRAVRHRRRHHRVHAHRAQRQRPAPGARPARRGRAGRSSSPTPTWTERPAHDGPGCRVRTSRTRHPSVAGADTATPVRLPSRTGVTGLGGGGSGLQAEAAGRAGPLAAGPQPAQPLDEHRVVLEGAPGGRSAR